MIDWIALLRLARFLARACLSSIGVLTSDLARAKVLFERRDFTEDVLMSDWTRPFDARSSIESSAIVSETPKLSAGSVYTLTQSSSSSSVMSISVSFFPSTLPCVDGSAFGISAGKIIAL